MREEGVVAVLAVLVSPPAVTRMSRIEVVIFVPVPLGSVDDELLEAVATPQLLEDHCIESRVPGVVNDGEFEEEELRHQVGKDEGDLLRAVVATEVELREDGGMGGEEVEEVECRVDVVDPESV